MSVNANANVNVIPGIRAYRLKLTPSSLLKCSFVPIKRLKPLYQSSFGFVDFRRVCDALNIERTSDLFEQDEKMVDLLGLRFGGLRVTRVRSSLSKGVPGLYLKRDNEGRQGHFSVPRRQDSHPAAARYRLRPRVSLRFA